MFCAGRALCRDRQRRSAEIEYRGIGVAFQHLHGAAAGTKSCQHNQSSGMRRDRSQEAADNGAVEHFHPTELLVRIVKHLHALPGGPEPATDDDPGDDVLRGHDRGRRDGDDFDPHDEILGAAVDLFLVSGQLEVRVRDGVLQLGGGPRHLLGSPGGEHEGLSALDIRSRLSRDLIRAIHGRAGEGVRGHRGKARPALLCLVPLPDGRLHVLELPLGVHRLVGAPEGVSRLLEAFEQLALRFRGPHRREALLGVRARGSRNRGGRVALVRSVPPRGFPFERCQSAAGSPPPFSPWSEPNSGPSPGSRPSRAPGRLPS